MLQKRRAGIDLGKRVGFFRAVSRELHRAIDQVWGGMFQMSLRLEKKRHASAREALEPDTEIPSPTDPLAHINPKLPHSPR